MPVFDIRPERGEALEKTSDYTATDDCTPLTVDDTQASTGDLTVTFDERGRPARWKTLKGQEVDVQVTGRAVRSLGRVSHVSGGDAAVSLAIDTVLNRLAVTRRALPQTGTLGSVLLYWTALCGLETTDVVIDSRIVNAEVAVTGFYDQVWLRMKQLAAALGFELVGRDNQLVARPPRPVTISIDNDLLVSTQWDVDDSSMVKELEVVFYEPRAISPGDQTPDYSRSSTFTTGRAADDPFEYGSTKARPINHFPAGWVGSRSIIT